MKKFYAFLKIKQDIARGKLCQNATVQERAKTMSLANGFATDLTSLVVDIKGRLVHSHWSRSYRTGLSLVQSSIVLLAPAILCH